MKKNLAAIIGTLALLFSGLLGISPASATPAPLQMTFTVDDSTGRTIGFPLMYGADPNAVVDWGDSTPTQTWTSKGFYQHTYATNGTYHVSVTGTVSVVGHNGAWPNHFLALRSVDSWGDGLQSAAIFLSGARNLESVPSTLPARFTDTSWMFYYSKVPAAVANWDMSHVKTATAMFYSATFNLDLSNWNLAGLDPAQPDIFNDSGWGPLHWTFLSTQMSMANYSSTLMGWARNANLPSGIDMNGADAGYCSYAAEARTHLTSALGWTISDGGTHYCVSPQVDSVTPAYGGAIAGGTSISISGSNFESPASVSVGGAACTSVVVVSSSQITCNVPAHASGAVDVSVTTIGQTATLTSGFHYGAISTPVINEALNPNHGSLEGGTEIAIFGSGFAFYPSVPTITVGGVACTSVNQPYGESPTGSGLTTALTCVTGPHAAGAVDVVVTNPDGGTVTAAGAFTYEPATVTLTADKSSVSNGDSVNFTTNANGDQLAAVFFNGQPALEYYFGPISTTPNPFPWTLAPVCTTGTFTYRIYNTTTIDAPSYSDPYQAEVQVTWVGDSSNPNCPYFTTDKTTLSNGQSATISTNMNPYSMAAIFVDHEPMPGGAYGPLGILSGNGSGLVPWNAFPTCSTVTLTFRAYDITSNYAQPLWTDPYVESFDITWVGDPGDPSCSSSNGSSEPPQPITTAPTGLTVNGSSYTINGTLLSGIISLKVGGIAVTYTVNKDGTISFTIPAGLTFGYYDIDLITSSGTTHWSNAVHIKAPWVHSVVSAGNVKTVAGFGGDSAKLTTKIKAVVKKAVLGAKQLTCTGTTSGTKITAADKKLALARAKAVCAYAKSVIPGLVTKVVANPAIGLGALARRVELIVTK